MTGQVATTVRAEVARVVLCHPARFNAMSVQMWQQLRDTFVHLSAMESLRCIVVSGVEGNFCAGGDISEYPAFRFDEAALQHFHEVQVWGALNAMLECDIPILARIDGICMGAGLEIACCCDLRVAASDARFGAPIARLGFPMAPREAQLLASRMGDALARSMLLAARTVHAEQLHASGFLLDVPHTSQLAGVCADLEQRIQALAPGAARLNKRTLRDINTAQTGMQRAQAATELIVNSAEPAPASPYAYAASAEHREGVLAFVEKRTPRF